MSKTEFVDSNVTGTAGTTFYYTVIAVDVDGDESPRSAELSPMLEPNPAKPELKIEDLWFRFALSFQFKSIKLLKYSIWL